MMQTDRILPSKPALSGVFCSALVILISLAGGGCFSADEEREVEASGEEVAEERSQISESKEGSARQTSDTEVSVEAAERRSRRSAQTSNREAMDELTAFLLAKTDDGRCPPLLDDRGFTGEEFANFALVEASKILVENRWGTASKKSEGEKLDLAYLVEEEKPGEEQDEELADSCPSRTQARLILASVVFDEITRRREVLKAPPEDERPQFLDEMHRTIVALAEQTQRPTDNKDARDPLLSAFDELRQRYGWTDEFDIPRHPPVSFHSVDFAAHIRATLLPKAGVGDEASPPIPKKWSGLPFSAEGLDAMQEKLEEFAERVTSGHIPIRPDNFTNSPNYGETEKKRHLDAPFIRNTFASHFPHVVDDAGRLQIRLELNPGAFTQRELQGTTITIDRQRWRPLADGDLGRHLLINGLEKESTVIDPIAWHYAAQQIGRYAAYLLERSALIARRRGQEEIDRRAVFAAIDREESFILGDKSPIPGATAPSTSTRHFRDVSQEAGFPDSVATYDGTGLDARFSMQRFVSSGVAVGDLTGNGYPDFYIAGEGLGRLYINGGDDGPGTFVDATEDWGLPEETHDVSAALFVDFFGDGDLELLLIRTDSPSQFFIQQEGQFVDVADDLGFRTRKGAHTASVADFFGDGRLDIYVGYYNSERYLRGASQMNVASADGRNGRPNQLWRQNERGRFDEVSRRVGVADTGWTLTTAAFDHDRNGHMDIYVVNDFGPNTLYRNQGDGSFEEVSISTGTVDAGPGMNASFADVNESGYFDIYVSNIDMYRMPRWFVFPSRERRLGDPTRLSGAFEDRAGNRLLGNQRSADGDHIFRGLEEMFPDHDKGWCWSAAFFDYDLNGYEDLYVTNGWVPGTEAHEQKNQFYRRRGDRFELQRTNGVESVASNSRTVVAVDVDRNGKLDLLVNNYREPPRLLKNTYRGPNRSVQVNLTGPPTQPMAIGAVVELESGGRSQLRQVIAGSGYLAQEDPLLTFGVAQARQVDITVYWPDGHIQRFDDQPTGQVINLVYEDE